MLLSEIKYILAGIQIIILSKKGQVVHFLLKRACFFGGHFGNMQIS